MLAPAAFAMDGEAAGVARPQGRPFPLLRYYTRQHIECTSIRMRFKYLIRMFTFWQAESHRKNIIQTHTYLCIHHSNGHEYVQMHWPICILV